MTSNALSIRGVFSERPLSPTTIERMLNLPEPDPVTTILRSDDPLGAAAWTKGALEEAARFRKLVRNYVNARRAALAEESGERAYVDAVCNYIL